MDLICYVWNKILDPSRIKTECDRGKSSTNYCTSHFSAEANCFSQYIAKKQLFWALCSFFVSVYCFSLMYGSVCAQVLQPFKKVKLILSFCIVLSCLSSSILTAVRMKQCKATALACSRGGLSKYTHRHSLMVFKSWFHVSTAGPLWKRCMDPKVEMFICL